jgi:nucleotide-binding universal stress UspA family protein
MGGALIVVDFSQASPRAVEECARRFPGEPLYLLGVIEPAFIARTAAITGLDGEELQHKATSRADLRIVELLEVLRDAGREAQGGVVEGEMVERIVEVARREQATLVVLGLTERDAVDSLPWRVAAATGLPTLVVPEPAVTRV